MAVQDFWKDIVDRKTYDFKDGKPHDKLTDLSGSLIGIDISIWLYRTLGSISSARMFDTVPLVPVDPVLEWVKAKHKCCCKMDLFRSMSSMAHDTT
jgi:hypothetical protein